MSETVMPEPRRHKWFILGLVSILILGGGLGIFFGNRVNRSEPLPNQTLQALPTPMIGSTTTALVSPSPTINNLPPCPSETATGCDKTHLAKNKDNNGSTNCSNSGPAKITAAPVAIEDIAHIAPMGEMIGGHVTPIDHGYIYVKGSVQNPPRENAVYAPLTGVVTGVSRTARTGPSGDYSDYAVTVEATCTFRVRFSNMSRFAGILGEQIGQLLPNEGKTPDYKVAAGELIGYTGLPTAYGIDVWVENDQTILTGFIHPARYDAESWKLHMVDLFDNAAEPVRSQLLALAIREAEPRFGKIDYDQPGKLIGNWFLVDSGGYGGGKTEDYYKGHLSVVPDGVDPHQTIVSIGNYQGEPKQFAVVGNTPDPATVTPESNIIKYELSQAEYYLASTGQQWNGLSGYRPHIRTRAQSEVNATILLQVLPDEKLKMEVFPRKTARQVTGFTDQAVIYER